MIPPSLYTHPRPPTYYEKRSHYVERPRYPNERPQIETRRNVALQALEAEGPLNPDLQFRYVGDRRSACLGRSPGGKLSSLKKGA